MVQAVPELTEYMLSCSKPSGDVFFSTRLDGTRLAFGLADLLYESLVQHTRARRIQKDHFNLRHAQTYILQSRIRIFSEDPVASETSKHATHADASKVSRVKRNGSMAARMLRLSTKENRRGQRTGWLQLLRAPHPHYCRCIALLA